MARKKLLNSYVTLTDIAKASGKNYQTVYRHFRKGYLLKPAFRLTYIKFRGQFEQEVKTVFWKKRQLKIMINRLSKIRRGEYKGFIHPITKKPSGMRNRKKKSNASNTP